VSVKVLYGNGSAVDDLSNMGEFKIYDKWSGGSYIYYNQIQSLNASQNASGIYVLNYTVNNSRYSDRRVAEFGTHNINISAEKGNYSGWDDSDNTYTINAPNLEVWFEGVETSIIENGIDRFYLKFRNNGNIGIDDIYIKIQTNHSDSRMDSSESGSYTYNYYSCEYSNPLASGADSQCILYLKGIDSGTYKLEFKYAYGTSTQDDLKYNATNDIFSSSYYKTIQVSESSSSNDDDGSSGSSGDGTTTVVTTTTHECTTNSGCSSKYYCSSNTCKKLNCQEDQLISNHNCVDINILTVYNDTHQIKQGENITIPFYLNSTKYKLSSVYLDAVKPSNYNETIIIAPSSQTLIKNELMQYNITFSIPE
ncbi:MAG: hypothetical protein KAQ92_01535, partial [Candidatus Aenigmarchaeota archaeon]|nr:hypothetical protein [Candidatus Aenigmarchaeota archaeon]